MSPRTFTLSLVAVAVTIICLWAGCAHAQGRYQARYDRALSLLGIDPGMLMQSAGHA